MSIFSFGQDTVSCLSVFITSVNWMRCWSAAIFNYNCCWHTFLILYSWQWRSDLVWFSTAEDENLRTKNLMTLNNCNFNREYIQIGSLSTENKEGCLCESTRCTKFLRLDFIFCYMLLHVSDYISPLSGATFYKLYIAFGICRYRTSGCCVAIATQKPDVSACTGIYQMRCAAYKRLLLMMD